MLTNDVLGLPLGIYGQHLELAFDQSVQSWPSWIWDWTKGELIGVSLAILLVFILYAVIRRSPRRWWFYFWLATLPILFTIMFLEPFIMEPLFYHFEPLAAQQPALVEQLEKLVARGGLAIPPDRMFEMKASEKLKSSNAYVTGLGASKRVVVWDTTLNSMTTPEVLFVFGHEMGHYVLGHVRNSLICGILGAAASAFRGLSCAALAARSSGRKMAYPRNRRLGIASRRLLLIAAVFTFLAEPSLTVTAAGRSIRPTFTAWK